MTTKTMKEQRQLTTEQRIAEEQLGALEAAITDELEAAIGDAADTDYPSHGESLAGDIQPPTSIVRAAAAAAAQVFMAFERGYRMSGGPE